MFSSCFLSSSGLYSSLACCYPFLLLQKVKAAKLNQLTFIKNTQNGLFTSEWGYARGHADFFFQRRVQIVRVVTPRQFYFRHDLAYKICACSTSGSQNRAILAKRHAANKNKDNSKVAWSNLTRNSICCSKWHNCFPTELSTAIEKRIAQRGDPFWVQNVKLTLFFWI